MKQNMEKLQHVRSKRIISWPLEMLLRIFGIWPGVSYNPLCKMFWLIVMTASTSFQYLFLIIHARYMNFIFFIYATAACLALSAKLAKLIIFWSNQRKFDEMWNTILINYERSNANTIADDTTSKMYILHYLPNFIVAFNLLSVIMTSYNVLWTGIHYDETSNATRPYVLWMHFPFKVEKQSVYLPVIFLQTLYLLIVSSGAATINSVLIILIHYLSDQISIICKCLTKMPSEEKDSKMNVIVVKEMIQKHQIIITFSENIESIYTYIAMILLVLNTLISCGLGFVLVTSIGSPDFYKIIMRNTLFYCVINIETFVFCFAGEYLSIKSREIGEAAYSSPWYLSKLHGATVLFMIMRSQNQLTITMGKFMDLSLERFSTIIKTSASYMSVLLAMY